MATTTTLDSLLASLASGDAQAAILDQFEDLYPVSFDPSTGVLVVAEDN